ncbi:MAG: hypothetical protein AABZ47_01795 [Planctomycetota bacterium]
MAGVLPGELIEATVSAFFQSDREAERSNLADAIARTCRGNVGLVANLIGKVQIWGELPQSGTFTVTGENQSRVVIHYRLPPNYDPTQAHPLVLCMPSKGETLTSLHAQAVQLLGPRAAECVFVSPARPADETFHLPSDESAGMVYRLLRECKKRIHVDSNRAYLFGRQGGGDAAWHSALMNADLFAGLVTVQSAPQLPYPEQSLPLLTRNLGSMKMLPISTPSHPSEQDPRSQQVSAFADWLDMHAVQFGINGRGIRIPSLDAHTQITTNLSSEFLGSSRPTFRPSVAHWFRYPTQGRAGWLRVAKFGGEVWRDDQLSILPAAGTDRNEYITSVLKEHLGFLGGRIDGQTVDITAHRCAEIELLLPHHCVDFAQPITVRCNGRVRHRGIIQPDVKTLLQTTYDDWDFQRPVVARLTFRIRADDGIP